MNMLILDDGQKIVSALVENSIGTDSLLVPNDYWNRLNSQERKDLRKKLPILLRKYSKRIASPMFLVSIPSAILLHKTILS